MTAAACIARDRDLERWPHCICAVRARSGTDAAIVAVWFIRMEPRVARVDGRDGVQQARANGDLVRVGMVKYSLV